MKTTTKRYRYPGVQPFSQAQKDLFFGREDDTARLLDLLLSEKLTVLYGKSGYGKSSLLQAGIRPQLDRETQKGKRRYVPISIRFGTHTGEESLLAKFAFQVGLAMEEVKIPEAQHPVKTPRTVWGIFKLYQPSPNTVFILLFDQFEEFFSYQPDEQETFKHQLAELLYTDYPQFLEENEDRLTPFQVAFLAERLDVRAVFSIRSDRLSELDRLKDKLPAILHKRFELRALDGRQAKQAITGPAVLDKKQYGFESPAFAYEKSALTKILTQLADNPQSPDPDQRIEAFQLQIVCASIEKTVGERRLSEVTANDLPDFNKVFENYYADRIAELPEAEQALARQVLEYGLLLVDAQTGDARRLSRDAGELAQAYNVSPVLLENLERTYLIRREMNSLNRHNYEISHDTLIAPVLKARKEQEATKEKVRKERELAEEHRKKRRAIGLAVTGFVLFALALVALFFALDQKRKADEALQEVERKRVEVETTLNQFLEEKRQREKLETDQLLGLVETLLASGNVEMALSRLEEAKKGGNPDTRIQQKIQELKNQ